VITGEGAMNWSFGTKALKPQAGSTRLERHPLVKPTASSMQDSVSHDTHDDGEPSVQQLLERLKEKNEDKSEALQELRHASSSLHKI